MRGWCRLACGVVANPLTRLGTVCARCWPRLRAVTGPLLLSLVYRFFELLPGAEPDRFRSWNPDSLSSVRVMTTARPPLRYCERTKADQRHLVILTQTVGDS